MAKKQIDDDRVFVGSRNVFADLGLPHPEEALAKSELAIQISQIIAKKRLSQSQAAELLGIDQPKVSNLLRGRLSGFSTERLFRFLNALGRDIEIVIGTRSRGRSQGVVRVRRAAVRSAR